MVVKIGGESYLLAGILVGKKGRGADFEAFLGAFFLY
jgi:hypothetical protein